MRARGLPCPVVAVLEQTYKMNYDSMIDIMLEDEAIIESHDIQSNENKLKIATINFSCVIILLTKTTTAQHEVAPSYYKVRGLYFLAVVLSATINNWYNYYYQTMNYYLYVEKWYHHP